MFSALRFPVGMRGREPLDQVDLWDEAVKEIAITFEVPRRAADSWHRKLGDLVGLTVTLPALVLIAGRSISY